MGASKSKSAKVAVDSGEENDTGPTNSRKRNLMNKGNGRLESKKATSSSKDSVPRDGLSSAPSTGSGVPSPVKRTHSAPRFARPEEGSGDRASVQKSPSGAKEPKEGEVGPPPLAPAQSRQDRLGEYVIEGPSVTAAQVDEYLTNVLGSVCTKNLRSAAWAQRVQGLELISSLLHDRARAVQPLPLYKACVSVLARALQDKVVPVFLPALQLLVDVYADDFLSQLPAGQPLHPLPLFARQLVLRSGSSNVRAKEESIGAVMQMARSAHVGPAELAPYVQQHGQSGPLGSGPARPLCVLRARLTAPCSSALPGRGLATGIPATASAARASRLQSRRFHLPLTGQVLHPLANGKEKSVHAALGRLELLHSLVIKHGFSPEHGFGVAAVLPFVLPLCSSASDKTREAASALLREAHAEYPAMLAYAKASLPEAVGVIARLQEKTEGPASPKKEKPSLAQFKQTHEPFARKQALPGISGADGIDNATGATGATGATKPMGAGRGEVINISNISKPKKARALPAGPEMREIDELLQEYGLE